jgi:hypothetical protein
MSRKYNGAPILWTSNIKETTMILFVSLIAILFAILSIAPLLAASADADALVSLPE